METGDADCEAGVRTGLAMTGVLQGVRCAARHMGPALQGVFVGQGPCALPGVRCKAESPSHGCAVPAPFRQGGLGTRDADCHSQCAHWPRNDSFIFPWRRY